MLTCLWQFIKTKSPWTNPRDIVLVVMGGGKRCQVPLSQNLMYNSDIWVGRHELI